jgi:uncharacterized cofD-like protein
VVVIVVGLVLIAAALWQLRRSIWRLLPSLVEDTSIDLVYSNPGGLGLPTAIVFSGHGGLLVVLSALKDSAGRVFAVAPPGSDVRRIVRTVHTSYPDVHVVSATVENAQLCARLETGEFLEGTSTIEREANAAIDDLYLTSSDFENSRNASWPVSQDLKDAINVADLIVFGPGSFYTSVIPALLVPGVRERIAASEATTVLVCNIMTEPALTHGYAVTDFISRFREYAGFSPDYTIVSRSYPGSSILAKYEITGSIPVMVSPEERMEGSQVVLGEQFVGATVLRIAGSVVIEADVIKVISENRLIHDPGGHGASEQTFTVIRHDPEKLARVLRGIIARGRARRPVGSFT